MFASAPRRHRCRRRVYGIWAEYYIGSNMVDVLSQLQEPSKRWNGTLALHSLSLWMWCVHYSVSHAETRWWRQWWWWWLLLCSPSSPSLVTLSHSIFSECEKKARTFPFFGPSVWSEEVLTGFQISLIRIEGSSVETSYKLKHAFLMSNCFKQLPPQCHRSTVEKSVECWQR